MIKKILLLIPIAIICMSLSGFVNTMAFADNFHTSDSSVFGEEDSFDGLNYGFYYVKRGNLYEKVAPGEDSPLFDKTKPTMIFVHGYQLNAGYFSRETMACYDESWIDTGDSENLADYWIDKGYNVLVYQWNQLCDEGVALDAMNKIWTADGPKGLRWRKKDGSYTGVDDPSNPTEPVTISFINDYLKIFDGYKGEEIRMTGHSLGGMFTIAAMGILYDKYTRKEIGVNKIPMRFSLLDPFLGVPAGYKELMEVPWKSKDDPLRKVAMSDNIYLCKDYIRKLHGIGVAIDYYKGTLTGDFGLLYDENNPLDLDITPYVALINLDASGLTRGMSMTSAIGAQHCSVRDYYFYSFNFDAVPASNRPSNRIITASTPTTEVYASSGKFFSTTGAIDTLSPADDSVIETERGFKTPYTGGGIIAGFVFNDINNNGLRDDGPDTGIKNIRIELYDKSGNLIGKVKTDERGFYKFATPPQGEYYLEFSKKFMGNYSLPDESDNPIDIPSEVKEGRIDISVGDKDTNYFINSGQTTQDYLSNPWIITYFAAGVILLIALSVLAYIKAQKKL
ncbi:MAG: SdrD B-like domain-containing protein [Christensenellales bacterium]|jgi:hypothetical protein